MARWNETEFIKHAQGLAEQHVTSKKSLNELSQKFATENNLNPEEIRTLVRLANVATFQELFKRKDGGDKMIEFDTGDPEAVIRNMVTTAETPPESANIHNDKLSSELPNLMKEKRRGELSAMKLASLYKEGMEEGYYGNAGGHIAKENGRWVLTTGHPEEFPKAKKYNMEGYKKERVGKSGRKYDLGGHEEKEAAEYAAKPAREDVVVMNLRKLASEFTIAKIAAGAKWEEKLASLATVFKRAPGYGPKFTEFEKAAWADFGSEVAPEMAFLYEELRITRPPPTQDKIAHLQDRLVVDESPELALLKEAYESRLTYEKMQGALSWVDKNMPALGR